MLLQPLVENAVAYGVADAVEGGETVVGPALVDGAVRLTVEDSGVGLDPEAEPGVGIGNVRRRLETRWGSRASLTVERREGGGTVARIILPHDRDEPDS